MAKKVSCNHAVGRFVDLLKAESTLELTPGATPLEGCDWATTGASSAEVAHQLRSHVSRTHGFDLDTLKPELRDRALAAILDA